MSGQSSGSSEATRLAFAHFLWVSRYRSLGLHHSGSEIHLYNSTTKENFFFLVILGVTAIIIQ